MGISPPLWKQTSKRWIGLNHGHVSSLCFFWNKGCVKNSCRLNPSFKASVVINVVCTKVSSQTQKKWALWILSISWTVQLVHQVGSITGRFGACNPKLFFSPHVIPSLPVLFQATQSPTHCCCVACFREEEGQKKNGIRFSFACKCWTSSDIWPKAKCLSFQRNDGIVRLGPPRERVKVQNRLLKIVLLLHAVCYGVHWIAMNLWWCFREDGGRVWSLMWASSSLASINTLESSWEERAEDFCI